jgi:hypothetical protein
MSKWIARLIGVAAILLCLLFFAVQALLVVVLLWVVLGPQSSAFDSRFDWLVNGSVWLVIGLLVIAAILAARGLFRATASKEIGNRCSRKS